MLGARIDVIQPQIRNLIAYLLPLPDKKTTTAVVKRDKTSGLDRKDRQKCLRLQRTLLIRKGSIKYFVVMGASEDFLHVTTVVYEIMSVCMCVKQQIDDLYIIICNCIYIVVINCGWNNNVAVKIVAC